MLLVSGAAATLVAFLVAVISLCRGTQKQHYRTVAVLLFTAGAALHSLFAKASTRVPPAPPSSQGRGRVCSSENSEGGVEPMLSVVLLLGGFIGPEEAAGGFANASDKLNPQLPRRARPPSPPRSCVCPASPRVVLISQRLLTLFQRSHKPATAHSCFTPAPGLSVSKIKWDYIRSRHSAPRRK